MDLSMFRRRIVSRRDVLFWASLVVGVAVIKIAFLFLDRLPLFYLGDSGVYLWSAVSSSMPNDRSFTYGVFLIRPILAVFGSLGAVVVFQSLVSGASAILAGVCMRGGFDAPLWVVAVTAVAYALEPLALIQERLILTETVALFCLALFVLVGLIYIRQPRWFLIPLLAVIGTIGLSLRSSFIPMVIVATAAVMLLGAPRLREQAADREKFLRRLLLHVMVAIVATAGFHAAYKQYFSYMTNSPPSYNAAGSFFLIASWAPLITKADFPNERVANRILPKVKYDPSQRANRPLNRFWRDGLVGVIIKAENGNEYLAQKLAGKVARKAALRNPLGLVRLTWETYTDFWNSGYMYRRLAWEQGGRELSNYLLKYFNEQYEEDLSGHHLQSSVTKQWHLSASYWYRFLLLSPILSLLTIVIADNYRRSSAFIGIVVCTLMVVNCALVTEPVFRYLQPVAWLTFLQLGQFLCFAPSRLRRPALGCASS